MAHIASCVVGTEEASVSVSPSPANSTLSTTPPNSSTDKPFAWRMLPAEQKKYQLFPKDKPLPVLNVKQSVDPETAFEMAMSDKQSTGTSLRLRLNQQHHMRRRKVSIPELGPMTTVQEVAMDSPTIPGRPPLHERSASAPDDARDGRKLPLGMLNDIHLRVGKGLSRSLERAFTPAALRPSTSHSQSRQLAPLVIPTSETSASLRQKGPSATLRSDGTPSVPPSRNVRTDNSPMSRSRATPSSSTSDLSYPGSASTDVASLSTLPTPASAPIFESYRATPQPWDSVTSLPATSEGPEKPAVHGHRRGASESSTSIMDRGRPRKRTGSRSKSGPSVKDSEDRRAVSCERKAFERLPKGWRPAFEAGKNLSPSDIKTLRKQALGQAERFEVLKVEDVEALSKELRRLDERTEYLRRTYTSLRAGRRNLHSRMCQYLRSPRVAKFSHDAMLKQEEALAELDASIDDWVTKLEQSENRRTRVRQKLLEHVAAATLLPGSPPVSTISESLHQVIGIQSPNGPRELSTPPRSPSTEYFGGHSGETSPSPQRVVAPVPVATLEEAAVEEAAVVTAGLSRADSVLSQNRRDVESIRVYAGDDVYALLADVQNEIFKLGGNYSPKSVVVPAPVMEVQDEQDTEASHQRSLDKIDGYCPSPTSPVIVSSVRAASSSFEGTDRGSAMARTPPSSLSSPVSSRTGRSVASIINSINNTTSNMASGPLTPLPLTPMTKDSPKTGNLLTSAVFRP